MENTENYLGDRMKKFTVVIEETVSKEFEVLAENEEQALNNAKEKYYNCEFVLDPGDLVYKQMSVINQDKETSEWFEF